MKKIVLSTLMALVILSPVTAGKDAAAKTEVKAEAKTDAKTANRLATLDAERAALKSLVLSCLIETPKSGNKWARFPLTFSYQAPNRFRSTIKTGGLEGDLIIVADGTSIWTYATKKKEVTKADQSEAVARVKANGPDDLLTVLATPTLSFAELFELVSEKEDGDNIVLEVKPKKEVKMYDTLILRTTKDGKTPVTAEALKKGKTAARVTFNEYKRNAEVAEADFAFVIPEGVKLKEPKGK